MKKDIEWLRHKLERLGGIDNHMRNQCEPSSGDQLYYDGSLAATERALDFIDELDSQEVLSQEKNINIVLHDLKEHIKEQQSLSQNIGLAHTSAGNDTHYRQYDYVLECIDEYEPSDELQNLLVPKQELPVAPKWFDEWWKDVPKGEGNLLHNIDLFQDELFNSGTRGAYNYIISPDNKKKLLNIIVNELDYEVEDEQKYFVSSGESVGFWFLSKNNDNEVVIGTNKDYYDRKWESLKLTEEEIKDYDSRYWAFAVKVEEVEE